MFTPVQRAEVKALACTPPADSELPLARWSVAELAACLTGWLDAPEDVRAATRDAIVAVTRERWSWDGVARTGLAAGQGALDALPHP